MTPLQSFSAGPQSPPHDVVRRPSTPAEKLRYIKEQRLRVHKDFAKLDRALTEEKLSLEEYRFYINKVYRGEQEHQVVRYLDKQEERVRAKMLPQNQKPSYTYVYLFLFIILASFAGIILFAPQEASLTGYVSAPVKTINMHLGSDFVGSGNYTLNVSGTEMLALSGKLQGGTAEIYLLVDDERLLVYEGESSPYTLYTDKESYALNETVNVTVIPRDVAHTLWLENELGQRIVVGDSFYLDEPGFFVLDALINDSGNITILSTNFTVRNETNRSNDINRELTGSVITFNETCDETCTINNTGNATLQLEILLSENTLLTIDEITTTQERENIAPENVAEVPDLELAVGERVELDLSPYFVDPDNDSLTYDFMTTSGVDMEIVGSTLSVTGIAPGSDQSIIYASDLYALVQSNSFTITVTGTIEEAVNETNSTVINETVGTNFSETTTNETLTLTNSSNSADCSNPDPNMRSLECLQDNPAQYFQEQEILITDTKRVPLARLTNIGNLLLTGDVVENAVFVGDTNDYVVGYEDEYGTFVVTIWFDSDSGNLHLKGSLFEEQANQVPPPGSYAFRNRKGITLAWANQNTGDLYLRGNLIPYRRSIE